MCFFWCCYYCQLEYYITVISTGYHKHLTCHVLLSVYCQRESMCCLIIILLIFLFSLKTFNKIVLILFNNFSHKLFKYMTYLLRVEDNQYRKIKLPLWGSAQTWIINALDPNEIKWIQPSSMSLSPGLMGSVPSGLSPSVRKMLESSIK